MVELATFAFFVGLWINKFVNLEINGLLSFRSVVLVCPPASQ